MSKISSSTALVLFFDSLHFFSLMHRATIARPDLARMLVHISPTYPSFGELRMPLLLSRVLGAHLAKPRAISVFPTPVDNRS